MLFTKKTLSILAIAALALALGCESEQSPEDFEHLRASVLYVQASFAEEEPYTGTGRLTGTMPEDVFESIVELRRLALEEAEQIDPQALARMDSNMPRHFEAQYLRGLRQWNEGIEREDYALANRGMLLLNDWGAYYTRVLEPK